MLGRHSASDGAGRQSAGDVHRPRRLGLRGRGLSGRTADRRGQRRRNRQDRGTGRPAPDDPRRGEAPMKWLPAGFCLALMAAAPPKTLEPPQPVLQWIYPAGGRQGTTVEVTLSGTAVEPQTVLVSGEGVRARRVDDQRIAVEIAADAPMGVRELRVLNAGGISNRFRFELGELPEIAEREPNSDRQAPQRIELLPVVVNGQIQEGDRDYFRFHATAGQTIV